MKLFNSQFPLIRRGMTAMFMLVLVAICTVAQAQYTAIFEGASVAMSINGGAFGDAHSSWSDNIHGLVDPLDFFTDTFDISGSDDDDGFMNTADAYYAFSMEADDSQEVGYGADGTLEGVAYFSVAITGPTGDYDTDVTIRVHSNFYGWAEADKHDSYASAEVVTPVDNKAALVMVSGVKADPVFFDAPLSGYVNLTAEVHMHDGHGYVTFELPITAYVAAYSENEAGSADACASFDLGIKILSVVGP